MKVLMVGNDPSVKGGITSVINQIMAHDWEKEGVEIKFLPTYIEANNAKKILFFANAYRKIEVGLKSNRPDVVHIHMSYKGSFTRKFQIHKLCKKYGIPDVIHLHGSEFKKWYDKSDDKKKEKIRTLMKECSTFIVLGEKWNKVIKEIEPMTNTLVVSNTVHVPESTVHWDEPFKILFMGVLIQRKGVADLLKAAKLLKDEKKAENVKFIIAGSGAEEESLKNMSKELGLDNCVNFVGWADGEQKKNLYETCQMLVLPSYNEGLPMSILEAMSYGMPIVSTNVGDISSAVIDGENGYLIEPGNVEALADALAMVAGNKTVWERFSHNSKNTIIEKFNEKTYFEDLLLLWNRVVNKMSW